MIAARHQRTFKIVNALGLHARAAAILVQTANRYRSEIHVEKDGTRVNGKSIMGVLTLAAAKGTAIVVVAEGDDAEVALTALAKVIEGGFGET
jgi:phosphocarrier protein HPr